MSSDTDVRPRDQSTKPVDTVDHGVRLLAADSAVVIVRGVGQLP